jgi:hypothetical protein
VVGHVQDQVLTPLAHVSHNRRPSR